MEEKIDGFDGGKEACVGDVDDLVVTHEVPGNGFVAETPKDGKCGLDGDGLVMGCDNGFVSKNPKDVRNGVEEMRSHGNCVEVMEEKIDRFDGAKEDCVGDVDDLVITHESKTPKDVRSGRKMRSCGKDLEVEQKKARLVGGDDFVINREVCDTGFVSENPKAARSGMKMRSCGNDLEVEQKKKVRLVGDGDDFVISHEVPGNGFVSKTPKDVRSGMKMRSLGNNLKVEQEKTARLVDDGDVVINRDVRVNGFVSKSPKVVWNWVEVTKKNDRLDHDSDDEDDCSMGTRSKEMDETSARFDGYDNDGAQGNYGFNGNGDGNADDKDYWVSDVEDSDADESYKIYLSCLGEDGEVVDFTALKSKMKKSGDHRNGVADSNEKAKPSCDEGKKSQNTPLKSSCPKSNGIDLTKLTDNTKFREELIEILKEPYNQKEYERLWDDISLRKPIQQHRDLRGRIIIYPVDRFAKSYLDLYPDLAAKIKSPESDKRRVLNLLRGFFYWLKNLCHEGVFHPWKDSMCLEILPETYNMKASKKCR